MSLTERSDSWLPAAVVGVCGSSSSTGEGSRSVIILIELSCMMSWALRRYEVSDPTWLCDWSGYGFGLTGLTTRLPGLGRADDAARSCGFESQLDPVMVVGVISPDGPGDHKSDLSSMSRSMLSSVVLPASDAFELIESSSLASVVLTMGRDDCRKRHCVLPADVDNGESAADVTLDFFHSISQALNILCVSAILFPRVDSSGQSRLQYHETAFAVRQRSLLRGRR